MSNKNLSSRYYKKGTARLEGMNSKGWWFDGGTSFMSNGYVIYYNGLNNELPNPTALAQSNTYKYRMFDQRSLDKRASYGQFTTQLTQIAQQAATKEEKYLKFKFEQLKKSNIEVNWLDKIEQAINEKDYSTAYTLLLRRDKDLEKFREELNSKKNHSIFRTNEFFNSQFYKYIAKEFEKQLEGQMNNDKITVRLDKDFDKIFDDFLVNALGFTRDNKVLHEQSLNYIRNQFIEQGLKKINGGQGIKISGVIQYGLEGYGKSEDHFSKLDDFSKKFDDAFFYRRKIKGKTKVKKYARSPKQVADRLARALMDQIGRGLSTELYTIGQFQQIGSQAYSTGSIGKDLTDYLGKVFATNVQQKTDAVIFDVAGGEISIGDIFAEIYKEQSDISQKELYAEVSRRIREYAQQTNAGEFFELAVSVKGYRSTRDISISQEGSFMERLGVFNQLKLNGGMVDKLIFMLNNTVEGCIADDRIEEIEDYLASVCVAWAWDNPEEIFDLDVKQIPNYNKIYLFNINGVYLTSSQIIQQTLNRLTGFFDDDNRFVQVSIKPPRQYTDNEYHNLVEKYSVNGIRDQTIWQQTLKKRWEEVKMDAMKSGAISIHFNQKELESLLGNLRKIINS